MHASAAAGGATLITKQGIHQHSGTTKSEAEAIVSWLFRSSAVIRYSLTEPLA